MVLLQNEECELDYPGRRPAGRHASRRSGFFFQTP